MTTVFPGLPALLGALLLASLASGAEPPSQGAAAPGLDTQPEGPALQEIKASGEGGASARAADDAGVFRVEFPPADGKPAAVFTFKETDINERHGIALDLKNLGAEPLTVYADLNGDPWVRGFAALAPGQTGTLYVFERRKKHLPAVVEQFPGMHGLPGGRMALWAGIEEPVIAKEVRVFAVKPSAPARIEVRNLRPFGSSRPPDPATLFPFIDRYGQYNHKDWPGKTHADADLKAALDREDADLAGHPGPADFDPFGGWASGPKLEASGHFRVEKHEGKWWLVDPDGRLFWSSGIDLAGFNQSSTRVEGRKHFYEDPAPMGNFLARNLQTKYGEKWNEIAADRLLRRIRSWGMNTLGGGADRAIVARQKIPYTLLLSSGGRGNPPDPDSPAWVERLRGSLAAAAERIKDDRWCIGFFVDNELHVSNDPGWWERYYRQVGAAAKEILPHYLYLGSRLDYHTWPDVPAARHEIVRHAAKYCDIVSFNFYKFTLDDVAMPEGVDRPLLIGEFHFGALDRGMFHTGLRSVVDQNHRAEAYRAYVTSALRNPAIVGAHWFQCYDESTTGRFDGENYQIGFLDICDTPYAETVQAARDVGYPLYSIRAGKK